MSKSITLQHLAPDQTYRSFGFYIRLDGNAQACEQRIKELNRNFINALITSRLLLHEVNLALRNVHLPAILYSMKGLTPKKELLIRETNFLISNYIPLMKINRHIPIAIRHAPTSLLGFNLPHLYCEMGIITLQQWITHVRDESDIGKILIINAKWNQLHAGLNESFLTDKGTPFPHLSDNRLKWMRTFLHDIEGKLEIEIDLHPPKNCEKDVTIISFILASSWNENQLIRIKKTRIYFRVYWVTDIIDPYNHTIHPYYLQQKSPPPSLSNLEWPAQDEPNKED